MTIQALVIAGGLSSRTSGHKMLYPLAGQTMIERVVLNFKPFCQKVIVVTGYNGYKIKQVLKKYTFVTIVHNDTYQKGMFNSIQTGVQALACDRFFYTPGDYPLVKKNTLQQLLDQSGEIVIPSYHYHAGHPVLLSGNLAKEITEYSENKTLRDLFHEKNINYVNVNDQGILTDVDTDEKYKEVLRCMTDED
jgi:molybdenum cofactor cytidylyltransferase